MDFCIGKRVCPGEAMAMDTLFVFTVSLLGRFNLDVVNGQIPTTDPGTPALTLSPQPYVVSINQIRMGS